MSATLNRYHNFRSGYERVDSRVENNIKNASGATGVFEEPSTVNREWMPKAIGLIATGLIIGYR